MLPCFLSAAFGCMSAVQMAGERQGALALAVVVCTTHKKLRHVKITVARG
eukprot:SAG22_NODE_280_length_13084_cov_3.480209_11_plen_50_part_00